MLSLGLGVTSSLTSVDALVRGLYSAGGVLPRVALDFDDNNYVLDSGPASFNKAFMGTSPKLTYAATSNSTMVDSSGNLVWAPHNLLTDSEDFEAWSKSNVTVTDNATTAPDGTLAYKIVNTGDTGGKLLYQNGLASGQTTVAVYAKVAEFTRLRINELGGNRFSANFDLSTENATLTSGVYGLDARIKSVGGGWYLCEIDHNAPSATNSIVGYPASAETTAGNPNYDADDTSGIYLWGAHVYRSDLGGMAPVPGADTGFETYVPTNGSAVYLPRVGHHVYNGSTWVNEGLLIESEPRTNLVTHSVPDNTNWTVTGLTLDDTTGYLAPDGTQGAVKLTSSGSGTNRIRFLTSLSGVNSYSFYAKAGTGSYVQILDGSSGNYYANFDLSLGSEGTKGNLVTSLIEDVGSSWYRCTMVTDGSVAGVHFNVYIVDSASAYYGASSTSADTVYIWGFQLEAAPTPSSYIPTSGSTVTRGGQSLTVPPAEFGWNTDAVSIQMDGRMTYADEDVGASATFVTAGSFVTGTTYVIETVGTTNFTAIGAEANTVGTVFTATGAGSGDGTALPMTAQLAKWGGVGMALDTHDTATGGFVFTTDDGNTEYVETSDTALAPGINVPFNISSRHGSTFVNGAVDGVALTASTTPTALPDLSSTNLQIAYNFMGTVGKFRQFAGDVGDAGLEEASLTPYGTDFVMTITTTGADETFTIPCQNVGTFDASIDWGDGSFSGITAYNDAGLAHTFASAGDHTIRISGSFPNIYFNHGGDRLKVTRVDNLGDVGWERLSRAFFGCSNMTSFASGSTDTSAVTGMDFMFRDCSSLTSLDVSGFDTSAVTGMDFMFRDCSSLTSLDVSGFDTSAVTNMSYMFYNCPSLTSLDVSGFDTSSVADMGEMFRDCSSLTSLDVSGFDTSAVTNMSFIFANCSSLTSLDVSGLFDTSAVTNMSYMFYNCPSLTSLDVSGFDTSAVTSMSNMFRFCSSLTDVIGVENFDIEGLNSLGDLNNFMTGVTLPTSRYDALLVNWDAQEPFDGMSPDFGNSQYTAGGTAAAARANLISNDGWTITDGGTA